MGWFRSFTESPTYASAYVRARFLATIWAYADENDGETPVGLTETEVSSLFELVSAEPTSLYVEPFSLCDSCNKYSVNDTCGDCSGCSDCCTCLHCERCGETCEHTCSACDRCETCCQHYSCARCGEPVDSTCDDCDRCEDCCQRGCYSSGDFRERDTGEPWQDKGKRLCGVEWEFNDCRDSSPINEWLDRWRGGLHEDGSCGWEAVTAPIAGQHIDSCLRDLGRAFKDAGTEADSRCGLHVHVDASDYSWHDLYRLLSVFSHLEPLLFALAGEKRLRSSYCGKSADIFRSALSLPDRKNAILALAGGVADGSAGRLRARRGIDKKDSGRYRSLNVMPFLARMSASRRGGKVIKRRVSDCTVEFRLHRNTLDAKRVAGWAKLCVAIVDWCGKASDAEANALQSMSALRALVTVAPELRGWILERIRQWRGGTRRADGAKRLITYRPSVGWTEASSAVR